MSTDGALEDLSALDTFLQVEQQADVLRAFKHLYTTAGSEPLALVALRYGFGYDLDALCSITGKSKYALQHTLQESLRTIACSLNYNS